MIKIDMEMPTCCHECRFMDESLDCIAVCDEDGTRKYGVFHCEPTNIRQDFCPLQEA